MSKYIEFTFCELPDTPREFDEAKFKAGDPEQMKLYKDSKVPRRKKPLTYKQIEDDDGKNYARVVPEGCMFIDFDNPEKNDFYVTEEYSVMRSNGKNTARPYIVMFINGIPLAIIECKDVGGVSITQGISQNIRNQKPEYIPELMKFIQILDNLFYFL